MGKDIIGLRGFISVELVNEDGSVRRKVTSNEITPIGKMLMLNKSAGNLMGMTATMAGSGYVSSDLNTITTNADGQLVETYDRNRLTNVLLNTAGEKLMNQNRITHRDGQLVGYASAETELGEDETLEGSAIGLGTDIGLESGIGLGSAILSNPYTVGNAWVYPPGVATGEINAIAMVPGGVVASFEHGVGLPNIDNPIPNAQWDNGGLRYWRCLDGNLINGDGSYSNSIGHSTGFCPPGVPGLTTDDEILLNYGDMGTGERWRYNLVTGITTEVEYGYPFWVCSRNTTDIYVEGSYIYSITLQDGSLYFMRDKWDDVSPDGESESREIHRVRDGEFPANISTAKFLKYNGKLYVTVSGQEIADDGTYEDINMLKPMYRIDNYSSMNGFTIEVTGTSYSAEGLSSFENQFIREIPEDSGDPYRLLYDAACGNYGDQFIVYMGSGVHSRGEIYTSLDEGLYMPFTVLDRLGPDSVVFKAGDRSGVLRVGADKNVNKILLGREGVEKKLYSDPGVYLSMSDWAGNVVSYAKLDYTITKNPNETMYVTYNYEIQ